MEYFEHVMIFYPEVKIFIKFHESDSIWCGKVPAFPDIYIKSPNLNDVISQIGTILNDKMDFIMNTEKRTFIKEMRKSDMVIEYWGTHYFCIYRTRHSNLYNIIVMKKNENDEYFLVHKVIDESGVKELLNLCAKITMFPPDGDGSYGLYGSLHSLKIKTGVFNNYSNICWWSESDSKWAGLTDVINKLNEIYDMNFGNV